MIFWFHRFSFSHGATLSDEIGNIKITSWSYACKLNFLVMRQNVAKKNRGANPGFLNIKINYLSINIRNIRRNGSAAPHSS